MVAVWMRERGGLRELRQPGLREHGGLRESRRLIEGMLAFRSSLSEGT